MTAGPSSNSLSQQNNFAFTLEEDIGHKSVPLLPPWLFLEKSWKSKGKKNSWFIEQTLNVACWFYITSYIEITMVAGIRCKQICVYKNKPSWVLSGMLFLIRSHNPDSFWELRRKAKTVGNAVCAQGGSVALY